MIGRVAGRWQQTTGGGSAEESLGRRKFYMWWEGTMAEEAGSGGPAMCRANSREIEKNTGESGFMR